MRENDYTLIDLLDQLRNRDVVDMRQVAFAILETNGTMSVLQKSAFQSPTLSDLGLPGDDASLSEMLVLDGALCRDAMARLELDEAQVRRLIREMGACSVRDVFFLHRSSDGAYALQRKMRAGGELVTREGKKHA